MQYSSVTPAVTEEDTIIASYALKQLAIFLVQENENSVSELVPLTILNTLIQLGTNLLHASETSGFPPLLSLMDVLASAGGGRGHLYLFQAACIWLEHLTKTHTDSLESKDLLQSATHVLSYVCDVLSMLRASNSPPKSHEFSFDASLNDEIHKIFQSQIILDSHKDTEKVFEYVQQKLEAVLLKEKAAASKAGEKKSKKAEENIFGNNEAGWGNAK